MPCQIVLGFALLAESSMLAQHEPVGLVPIAEVKEVVQAAARPKIQRTEFGAITIDAKVYRHDIIIRLDGKVEKRKKRLSKQVYSTSHIISMDEAKQIYQEGAKRLIVGSGQTGMVKLSDEAAAYFKQKGCTVELAPTPAAVRIWNDARGAVIALFHVTC